MASQIHRTIAVNRAITQGFIGTTIGVFGAWNYANRGPVYNALQQLQSTLPFRLPDANSFRQVLQKDFLLNTRTPENYKSWILSALSHQSAVHLAFNLITLSSFSGILTSIPTRHFATLLVGSAIASSGTFLYEQRSKGRNTLGLGASGIVSGVLAAVTCLAPRLPIRIMGVVPMPLIVSTAGYFLIDTYMMQNGPSSIGHSAHLGGGAFGALYYLIFLRRMRFVG